MRDPVEEVCLTDEQLRHESGCQRRLALFDKDGRTMLKAFDYKHITPASYSRTAHPGVFVFGRGTRHWFSVQTGGDAAVLRLDKSNQARILSEFQRLSGRAVKKDAGDALR